MSQRRVFLLGGANTAFIGKGHPDFVWKNHPDFGKRENPNLEEHLSTAVHAAFATTGVNPERVDKGYIGNFVGELFCQGTAPFFLSTLMKLGAFGAGTLI